MKYLHDDESSSFETLRAAGYAAYAGADLGEVLVTCRQIPEGDEEARSAQWAAPAARIERTAGTRWLPATASAPGRRCCARPTTTGPPTSTAARIPPPTPSRSNPCSPGLGRTER